MHHRLKWNLVRSLSRNSRAQFFLKMACVAIALTLLLVAIERGLRRRAADDDGLFGIEEEDIDHSSSASSLRGSSSTAEARLEQENEENKLIDELLSNSLTSVEDEVAAAAGGRSITPRGNNKEAPTTPIQPTFVSPLSRLPPNLRHTSVILFCYSRPQYLSRTFESILARIDDAIRAFGGREAIDVVISQDGDLADVTSLIQTFARRMKEEKGVSVRHFRHEQMKNFVTSEEIHNRAYFALAAHYKYGLSRVFSETPDVGRVIILEDDLELAVDFFSFMAAAAPIVERDETLFAASAWNDNGKHVLDPERVLRADFFPGLGWLMPKRLWSELEPKWPRAFWDDWLREPPQRKGRQVIRPEVSRTITFGETGASAGQYFNEHLRPIVLNTIAVDFAGPRQFARLKSELKPDAFRRDFRDRVDKAREVSLNEARRVLSEQTWPLANIPKGNVRARYSVYETAAASLGLIADRKAGIPRGAYEMVVPLRSAKLGVEVFLIPSDYVISD